MGGSQDSTAGVIPSGEQAVGLASCCQVHIVTPEHVPKGAVSLKTAKDLSSASAASLRPRDRAKWKRPPGAGLQGRASKSLRMQRRRERNSK